MLKFKECFSLVSSCHISPVQTGLHPSAKPGTSQRDGVSVFSMFHIQLPVIDMLTDEDVWNIYLFAWVNTVHQFLMALIIIIAWKHGVKKEREENIRKERLRLLPGVLRCETVTKRLSVSMEDNHFVLFWVFDHWSAWCIGIYLPYRSTIIYKIVVWD